MPAEAAGAFPAMITPTMLGETGISGRFPALDALRTIPQPDAEYDPMRRPYGKRDNGTASAVRQRMLGASTLDARRLPTATVRGISGENGEGILQVMIEAIVKKHHTGEYRCRVIQQRLEIRGFRCLSRTMIRDSPG